MAATITTAQPGHVPALGLRRRVDDARLAERLALLVRRNEALDDFASLVAHELKGSLLTAASGDPDGSGEPSTGSTSSWTRRGPRARCAPVTR